MNKTSLALKHIPVPDRHCQVQYVHCALPGKILVNWETKYVWYFKYLYMYGRYLRTLWNAITNATVTLSTFQKSCHRPNKTTSVLSRMLACTVWHWRPAQCNFWAPMSMEIFEMNESSNMCMMCWYFLKQNTMSYDFHPFLYMIISFYFLIPKFLYIRLGTGTYCFVYVRSIYYIYKFNSSTHLQKKLV